MNILWKGVAAILIAGSAMTATAVPAQAQYYRDSEWRGDRNDRWDRGDRRREWRRHHYRDDRRHYRDDRRYYRDDRRYYRNSWRGRDRCWTEWRYDRYRHRDVRVRICR